MTVVQEKHNETILALQYGDGGEKIALFGAGFTKNAPAGHGCLQKLGSELP